jgi:hypothetical protein
MTKLPRKQDSTSFPKYPTTHPVAKVLDLRSTDAKCCHCGNTIPRWFVLHDICTKCLEEMSNDMMDMVDEASQMRRDAVIIQRLTSAGGDNAA